MKKIVIAGFGQPALDLINNFKDKFVIAGVILDYERRKKNPFFYLKLAEKNIPIFSINDINSLDIDGVIVINYNKIIDVNLIKFPFILNIHMGILPLYRGNGANSWSILNGDRNVGYTLHQVSDILDGGLIYYKFKYEIKENETYFHAKKAINTDLKNNLPLLVDKIFSGKIKGINQDDEEFIYASKLKPEDGILEHWNYTTEEIINRNIIFSKPLGTGLKIKYKNDLLEIHKLSSIPKYKVSKGFSGAIVLKTNSGSVWIKTKDTAISIDELIFENKIVKPANLFKIGCRL